MLLKRTISAPQARVLQRFARRTAASVPHSCDVVVVVGGIVGCSTARELAKRGVSVTLLEQNTLTSGSTWHAAGMLGTVKGSHLIGSLARYGSDVYREMNDESGESLVGWGNTGSLGIARSADSMEGLVRQYQMARNLGNDTVQIVTPAEIHEIHPFLVTDGIVGGLYAPKDGICNPGDVTQWMAKDARRHGAVILERTEVVDINFDKELRRVSHISTGSGSHISCGHVVLCGGAWTKKLSRMMYGKNVIPVAMVPHQYACFDRIDGVGNHLPVCRDVEHKYYLKPEVGGFMVGVFEGAPLEHLPDSVRALNADTTMMPRDAEHEVYEESFEKAGEWLEAAMAHAPVLGEVGIKQWLHGPDTHSVDHSPLIGALPGSDNAYIATGFNSQGIQCGPGTGLSLCEMILDGAPHSIGSDFSEAEPTRVFPGLCDSPLWVEKRAAEGYGKFFSVHYPLEIFESARGQRFSPVHSELVEAGAVFGETYGWERPLYFPRPEERVSAEKSIWVDSSVPSPAHCAFSFDKDAAEFFPAQHRECKAAREKAALFDLSSFGKLRVSGPRALEVLQMCMTAEMDKKIGSATYSLFCDSRGGIQGDLAVTRLASDQFYITTIALQPGKVIDRLLSIATKLSISSEGCTIEDISEAKAMLALNGPQARNILKDLCHDPLDNDSFPPYTAQHIRVAGLEVLALRMSFAGELGWELHGNAAEASLLYKALMESGKKHGLVPAGVMGLLNSLRVEKGFVHYGADINPAVTPLEVGLAFACKLKAEQPDFIGKAAILAQREKGWCKRLVSVLGRPGDAISLWGHEQELLYRDGEAVGALTSGGHSHTLGCPIALAMVHGPPKVPLKWLKAGTYEVEVPVRVDGEVCLKRFPVQVSTRCVVDPDGARVLGTDSDRIEALHIPSDTHTHASQTDSGRSLRV